MVPRERESARETDRQTARERERERESICMYTYIYTYTGMAAEARPYRLDNSVLVCHVASGARLCQSR